MALDYKLCTSWCCWYLNDSRPHFIYPTAHLQLILHFCRLILKHKYATSMKKLLPTSSALDRVLKLAESASASSEREVIMSSVNRIIAKESRARRVEEGHDKDGETVEWLATLMAGLLAVLGGFMMMAIVVVFSTANLDDVEEFVTLRVGRGKRRANGNVRRGGQPGEMGRKMSVRKEE